MSNTVDVTSFEFQQFSISQDQCIMKSGEDGILLGSWSTAPKIQSILDIGAGTGVVSLILAQRFESASIDAVEVDDGSIKDCIANFHASPWNERMSAHHKLIQDFTKSAEKSYDLIVCNPPFFSGGTMSFNTDKDQIRNTTKLSHSDLLRSSKSLLRKEGRFCVILPLIEGLRFSELASTSGLYLNQRTDIKHDTGDAVSRLLLSFSLHQNDIVQDEITLYNSEMKKTLEFSDLTSGILK